MLPKAEADGFNIDCTQLKMKLCVLLMSDHCFDFLLEMASDRTQVMIA